MLKSIDILIGLSVVMLVVSMAVTLMTQALLALRQSRGRHLLAGLADLVEQIDPGFDRRLALEIAKLVLRSPAINGGRFSGVIRYGEVVHREEFTKMLLELVTQGPTAKALTDAQQTALTALKRVMVENGISDPEKTLDRMRMTALQLEKSNPELANDVRQNLALLQEASSQFLAKINLRFDSVIDRVSERFTVSARLWTLLSSTVVAVILQLDTVALVNQFAMDDAMRAAFVDQAVSLYQDLHGEAGRSDAAEPDAKLQKHYLVFLANQGVILPPTSLALWYDNWQQVNIPGLVVSILLLSLGAPFWYGALSRLLQLRSILARKDEVQRRIRQTLQSKADSPSLASAEAPISDRTRPEEP